MTRGFEIQATEVTQDQFFAMRGYKPWKFTSCGGACPVEWVNWHEAAEYCNALSTNMGYSHCYTCSGSGAGVICYSKPNVYDCPGYRLPNEAEWEYAYRAGTTAAYYSGANDGGLCTSCAAKDANADNIGWYCYNAKQTNPVGMRSPNKWGLQDMAGNVWEWCHDGYNKYAPGPVTDPVGASGSMRVSRGGSWKNGANCSRAASRTYGGPLDRFSYLGFRPVRSIQ